MTSDSIGVGWSGRVIVQLLNFVGDIRLNIVNIS